MDLENLNRFIAEVELFNTLSEEQIAKLIPLFEHLSFQQGTMLFTENTPREAIFVIQEGQVELFKTTPFGEEKRLSYFTKYDFLGEGSLVDDSPHSTSARAVTNVEGLLIPKEKLLAVFKQDGEISVNILTHLTRVVFRRMSHANFRLVNVSAQYHSGRTRNEHDLLGYRNVPDEAYYGIQTLRALENFSISGITLNFYPNLIISLALVKKAAALANHELGLLSDEIKNAIVGACDEIINGRHHKHFVVDMIQGGAGTSVNMNANEVIANKALEILGHKRGEYEFCHPNNHVNLSQSTNDAYPTSVNIALYKNNISLSQGLIKTVEAFRAKAVEFAKVIKMGRTQLQDAVPMTLGQTFEAYAATLEEEIEKLRYNADHFLEVNMGATAIGTGICSLPEYRDKVIQQLREVTGYNITTAINLVEATQDTGNFQMYSSNLKRLATKLSKISNDLRLMSSGPRCGLNEINLPPMQPGSSIMPGKVNPVIPEVVNQIAFKVIGNDLTITMASEAGQLELNVMEPVIIQSLFESVVMLQNGMKTLVDRCINGITANEEVCRKMVMNSIGLVTALNPLLGYEVSTMLAKEALETKRGVYDLVLEKGLLSKEELDWVLNPENMIKPTIIDLKKK